ncbi:MAG: MMPL family transporter [Gammaproteobacteria bacterium]|nr:MMPL family transporter [Gammaproteobacteria bacterium]
MKRFEAAFARWVITYRWLVILLSLALVAALTSGVTRLYFDSSYRVFFSKDNPQLLAFETLERTYTKNDNVLFVLEPASGDVFTRDTLAAVEELTTAAWQVPYSNRVDSITNFQYTEAEEDDLIVRDMVKDAASLSDAQLAEVKRAVLAEPALNKRLINDRGHVTAIYVTVQMPEGERTTATPVIVEAAREMARTFEQKHPDIKVYLTGMVLMDNAFSESGMYDSMYLVPLSFVLMLAIIAVLVGGFFGTFATLFVIGSSIACGLGAAGYIGFPITSVTTSAPIIILTVAVANCVHLLTTFLHYMREGAPRKAAMEESLRINLQPVFLASTTTAIGFLTMNFSDVPPFNHLGNIVSVGVVVSFLLTIGFLPAFMTLVPVRAGTAHADDSRGMGRLADFVIAHRRKLLWGSFAVVLATVANLPRNELNDVFVHYFGKSIQFRADTDFMVDNLTGIYTINYSLESGESGGIAEPGFLADAEAFAEWLEQQPDVIHVDRFTTVMKRLNKNMHGDDPAWYRLPEDRELAAQYLLLYEMSLPYGLDLNNQINVDKSSTRLTVTLPVISSNAMIALDDRATAWARANLHHVKGVDSAGTTLMFSHIGHRNIRSMLIGTTVALVLISGILMLALRSFRLGSVSLLPNLAPAAMGFGLWGIFVGEVGLSLSVVTGMTFGIVIDDTVHFLSKYLRARREQGLDPEAAVRYAFRTVGRALIITTVTLVVGFAVLSTSSFAINSRMGLMTAIIIFIALVGVFLMLPPLLMKIEEKAIHASSHDGTVDRAAAA